MRVIRDDAAKFRIRASAIVGELRRCGAPSQRDEPRRAAAYCGRDMHITRGITATALLALMSCASAGWTAESEAKLRSDFCVAVLGIASSSSECNCAVAATKKNYDSFEELSKTVAPTAAYRADMRNCGITLPG